MAQDGYQRDRFPDLSNGMFQATFPVDPEYPSGYLWDLLNMCYDKAGNDPEKLKGYSELAQVDGSVSGLFDFQTEGKLIVTSTGGRVYSYNGSTLTQITSPGAPTLSTDPTVRWDATTFYGSTTSAPLMILCNGNDVPQKTNGSTISALGGSAPSTGKFPVSWQGRAWMADGDVLYGSAVGNCEEWSTGGVNIEVDQGTGDIIGVVVFLEDMIIFKKDAIFRLPFGVTVENTAVKLVTRTMGAVASDSIKECIGKGNALLVFLSDNGLKYMYGTDKQGAYALDSLDEPVNNIVTERSTLNQGSTFATWNGDRFEYYLHIPRSDSVIVPNEGVICNLARGGRKSPRWTRHNMQGITAGGMVRLNNTLMQVLGRDDGKVVRLHDTHARDGDAFTGRLFTAAHSQGDAGIMKHYGRVYFDYRAQSNSTIDARYILGRENQPSPSANTDTLEGRGSPDGWGVGTWGVAKWGGSKSGLGEYVRLDQVRRGRFLRLLLETSTDNSWFKVSNYNIEYAYAAHQISG